MDAFPHHQIGQGHPCGQHSDSNFTGLRLWALFFNHLQGVGSSVVGDDNAPMFHGPLPYVPSAPARAARLVSMQTRYGT